MEEEKKKIYAAVEEYFAKVPTEEKRRWRVPVGGGVYDSREVNAVLACMLDKQLSTQQKVAEFERAFAEYIGTAHAVATNSGTSALILALSALMETEELRPGDEVILPATTFVSDAIAIIKLQLVPVYVDIERETLNIDPAEIEKAVRPEKTKAIIVVHTLGLPAHMKAIMDIARRFRLKVIEDCCEAHGALYHGKRVGQFGDISVFSFYVAHNMTTWEGGIVVTNSDTYHQIVAEMREFGRLKSYTGPRYGYTDANLTDYDERYVFHRLGYNFRMADPPAAFGLEQLKKLDALNTIRIGYAKFYIENIGKDLAGVFALPPLGGQETTNVFYGFPLTIKPGAHFTRQELTRHLESKGIETRAILCGTLPDQPALHNAPKRIQGSLPISRWIRDHSFFIGCHPKLQQDDLQYAVDAINEFCSRGKSKTK